MRVAVVGGNGNIGRSIVEHLVHAGHEVICFNRGLSGPVPDGTKVIRGDRHERADFEQVMAKQAADAAIDLVCFSAEDAQSSLRAFRAVGHFICCSSVATYGRELESLPATEDHPLRPSNAYGCGKRDADAAFMAAHQRDGFPMTLVKPAITYGPEMGLVRQLGHDLSWLDRIRKGKPLIVADDGTAVHQFLHIDDAGRFFAQIVGRAACIGEIYNLVPHGCTRWNDYHRTAMSILGREVELVRIETAELRSLVATGRAHATDIFSHNSFFSAAKRERDVPEFEPNISLEAGMARVIEALDRAGRIPDSDSISWEDDVIAAQRGI